MPKEVFCADSNSTMQNENITFNEPLESLVNLGALWGKRTLQDSEAKSSSKVKQII